MTNNFIHAVWFEAGRNGNGTGYHDFNKVFNMIRFYELEQTGKFNFVILGNVQYLTVKHGKIATRTKDKTALREFAINWQCDFEKFNYSFLDLVEWQDFFEHYEKKLGLLREFRENGIL